MDAKSEGAALPPIPLSLVLARESVADTKAHPLTEGAEARCEMCGAPAIATHCKRICLKCGFLTGCSEGT